MPSGQILNLEFKLEKGAKIPQRRHEFRRQRQEVRKRRKREHISRSEDQREADPHITNQRIIMATLEDAILLAAKAHRGRKDKAGAAYILHPLRVMRRMNTREERIVAVLHDLLEDTEYSLEDLREAAYSGRILRSLSHLTHRKGEPYEDFIERVKADSLACRVKIADLRDNLNLSRIKKPKERDLMRAKKYRRALRVLLKAERQSTRGPGEEE